MAGQNILVLAPDASEYIPWLEPLPVRVQVAENAAQASKAGGHQQVILGQPDLVAEIITEVRGLRWVQSTWAGVTPLINASRRDYLLTGVKEVFGPEMAEYVLGYLLAWELKMLQRVDHQANRSWWPASSGTLKDKTVCMLGTGSIGRHVGQKLRPFGVRLLGCNRSGQAVEPFEQVFAQHQLADFLRQADYLVCVLPDTAETRGMMSKEALAILPPRARIINVGRGTLFDELALAAALQSGRIAGAALDVFEQEPLPPDSPLWRARNTLITAHMAARSRPREIAAVFVENYRRFVEGDPLLHRIGFERGY